MIAKDPAVVKFKGKYYLYYSIPPYDKDQWNSDKPNGWNIGIAVSDDLDNWERIGDLRPELDCEWYGICAPGAIVINEKVHLFYQNYGNFPKDAICHAVSDDGVYFSRNSSNPIFSPTGDWNNGRAIDADVIEKDGKLLLYFATRDTEGKIQKLGVASADIDSDFGRDAWNQECNESILEPELPWEQECIEAPAVCKHNGRYFMFYGGAYNCMPQQIGYAVSNDGINWLRLSEEPFLRNGNIGEWNSSESGHPYIFVDDDGRTYLFFQGSNDNGKTWYLSKAEIVWESGLPKLRIE